MKFLSALLLLFALNAQAQKPAKELYEGITKGDLERVKKAVAAGADVNKNVSAKKPILWAIQTHRADVLKYLIEKGADVNDKSLGGSVLIKYAGSVETPEKLAAWTMNFYKKYKVDTVVDPAWYSPIAEITNILLDAGADVNERELTGRTVLQMALEMGTGSEEGRAQFIDALLKHSKKPNVNQRLVTEETKSANNWNFSVSDAEKHPTALMLAAKMNLPLIAKVLIDNGAKLNETMNLYGTKIDYGVRYATKKAVTALDIAKGKKNAEVEKVLVAAGAK
jgi:ankyrin repeat protein